MKSQLGSCALAAILLATLATQVRGHGIHFDIRLDGSDLTSTAQVEYTHPDSLFSPSPTAAPVRLRSAGGFYPVFGSIPAGTAFTVEAAGSSTHPLAMYYWNGGALVPSPVNVVMNRTGIGAFSETVSASDTLKPLTTLSAFSGVEGNHSAINLDLGLADPLGLYVFGFRVSAPGYTKSDTFWGIANNGITDPLALEQGIEAIRAAVPEPSSLSLGITGLLALSAAAIRRCWIKSA